MTATLSAPTSRQERISEVDIIRGFALFGVLWVNVLTHADLAIPESHLATLATASVDTPVDLVSRWLAQAKAQALFSLLFGFGFAIFMDRLDSRGADATRIYLRRVTILFLMGLIHLLLFWNGDILHMYALVGFLLLLTRRWPDWMLLAVGIPLALLTVPAIILWETIGYAGGEAPWVAEQVAGQARRWEVLRGTDVSAFLVENGRTVMGEIYGQPIAPLVLGFVLGRFMIGAWIYRQGWLQDPQRHERLFRRWAAILIPGGLLLSGVRIALYLTGTKLPPAADPALFLVLWTGVLMLALGYAAGLVVLCRKEKWRRRLSGLGAVGQMALTNYVAQSFFYIFILYGFGLGLLVWNGATFALAFSIAVFALQILFSRWWLARYRFGPLEGVWRSLTYWERQPMRLQPAPAA